MKNKLTVMLITFAVLILITPWIFGKLMNSKFNTMLLKLSQQNGIQIKEVKDKSSYLTTDRVFDVIIPGKSLDETEINYIKIQTEVTFKNLPVTDVKFLNTLEKIVLDNNKSVSAIENKIKILVTTPDFKVYKYKLFDNSIDLQNGRAVLNWKNFNGIYDEKAQTFKNDNGLIEIENSMNDFKIYNIKTFVQNLENKKIQQLQFDAEFSNKKFTVRVTGFNTDSRLDVLNNDVDLNSNISCSEINVSNMVNIGNINSHFEIKGINKDIYEKLQAQSYTREDIDKLLQKGFSGKFNLSIGKIFFMQDLGFLDLKSTFKIKNASINKINSNDISFLDLNMSLETSPQLADIMSNLFPPLKDMMVVKNKKAVVKLMVNKGNISINGHSIKSN